MAVQAVAHYILGYVHYYCAHGLLAYLSVFARLVRACIAVTFGHYRWIYRRRLFNKAKGVTMWTHGKSILLFLFLVLVLVPLSSEDSYIDQALAELQKLEDSLTRQTEQINSLQENLSREKLWSISLQRTIEELQNQMNQASELLMQQSESLNQADQALQKLERSWNFSATLNKIFIPTTILFAASTGILTYLIIKGL